MVYPQVVYAWSFIIPTIDAFKNTTIYSNYRFKSVYLQRASTFVLYFYIQLLKIVHFIILEREKKATPHINASIHINANSLYDAILS